MSTLAVRPAPWIGQAHHFDTPPNSVQEMLEQADLAWTVEQRPVFYQNGDDYVPFSYTTPNDKVPTPPPSAFVNVRSDTGAPLGIVSDRYAKLDNLPAFGWADEAIKNGDFIARAAGPLNGGKQVMMMLQMPKDIEVGGDLTELYAYITNSHDGFRAVRGAVSPIRVQCENQLPALIPGADRHFSIAHLGDPSYRLQEARKAVGITANYADQFKVFGDALAAKPITEKQLRKIMETLWPEGENITDRKKQNLVDKKNHIVWMWKEGPTVGNAPGSAWSAVNAITEFIDYGEKGDSDGKLTRAMTDPTGGKKKAFTLVASAVGVKPGA